MHGANETTGSVHLSSCSVEIFFIEVSSAWIVEILSPWGFCMTFRAWGVLKLIAGTASFCMEVGELNFLGACHEFMTVRRMGWR